MPAPHLHLSTRDVRLPQYRPTIVYYNWTFWRSPPGSPALIWSPRKSANRQHILAVCKICTYFLCPNRYTLIGLVIDLCRRCRILDERLPVIILDREFHSCSAWFTSHPSSDSYSSIACHVHVHHRVLPVNVTFGKMIQIGNFHFLTKPAAMWTHTATATIFMSLKPDYPSPLEMICQIS
jgi:hypothetical protein